MTYYFWLGKDAEFYNDYVDVRVVLVPVVPRYEPAQYFMEFTQE